MRIEPKFLKRDAQPYAGIRVRLARNELSEIVPRTLSELFAFLQRHRVSIIGAPLIRYLVVDYSTGEVEVDVGFRSRHPPCPLMNVFILRKSRQAPSRL